MKKFILLLACAISIFSCKHKNPPAIQQVANSSCDTAIFDSTMKISATFSLSSENDEVWELRNRLNFLEREVAYMKGDIEKATKHLQKKTSNNSLSNTAPAYKWRILTLDDMHWDAPAFGKEYWDTVRASTGQLIYDLIDSATKEQDKWWDENKNWLMKEDSSENSGLDSFIQKELKPDPYPLWKGEGFARGSYLRRLDFFNPWMGSTAPGGGQRKLYNHDGSVFDLDSCRANSAYADSAIKHMENLIKRIEDQYKAEGMWDSVRNIPLFNKPAGKQL